MNIVLYILVLTAYLPYMIYHLQFTELYNNAVYAFKYWHSLKVTINKANMEEFFSIQKLIQFVGDKLVYLCINCTEHVQY
jgi:hypothetical protein